MLEGYPLVCICIPNFNNEATIAETLDSLISQTYKNIIIKVFDNASTDLSLEILRSYEQRYNNIAVFVNEENIGGEANFTKCIEHMEGEYSAIFHSDDVYMPNIIEEEVSYLESDLSISFVSTNAYKYDSKGNVGSKLYDFSDVNFINGIFKVENQVNLIKLILLKGNFINCPSVMSRTSIYKDYIVNWNGSDFKTSADLDVWFRMIEKGSLGVIEKALIKYRISPSSYSYNLLRERTARSDFFLVLDDYMSRVDVLNFLDKTDYSNYEVLSFKDFIITSINKSLQKKTSSFWLFKRKFKVGFIFNFFTRKRSEKHVLIFLFYLAALLLSKSRIMSRFLFWLKYR